MRQVWRSRSCPPDSNLPQVPTSYVWQILIAWGQIVGDSASFLLNGTRLFVFKVRDSVPFLSLQALSERAP